MQIPCKLARIFLEFTHTLLYNCSIFLKHLRYLPDTAHAVRDFRRLCRWPCGLPRSGHGIRFNQRDAV